jgi:hypothetical protein
MTPGPQPRRARLALAVLTMLAGAVACSQNAPPEVPVGPNPALEPFRAAVQAYVERTDAERRAAVQTAAQVPGQNTATPGAETAVRTHANAFATAARHAQAR